TGTASSGRTACPAGRCASSSGAMIPSSPDGWSPERASTLAPMSRSFWIETLGCPKNQVDSDKLTGTMLADGLVPAAAPEGADLVVVNTCAFIEEARQESIDVVLDLAD